MAPPQTFDTFWNSGDGAPDAVGSGYVMNSMKFTFNISGRLIGLRRWRTASSSRMALGVVSSADGVVQAATVFAVPTFPATGGFERAYLHPYVPISSGQTIRVVLIFDGSDVWSWSLKALSGTAALTRGHMTIPKNISGTPTVWNYGGAQLWRPDSSFVNNPYYAFDPMFQPAGAIN